MYDMKILLTVVLDTENKKLYKVNDTESSYVISSLLV